MNKITAGFIIFCTILQVVIMKIMGKDKDVSTCEAEDIIDLANL